MGEESGIRSSKRKVSYFEKLDIFYSFEFLYFYYFWKIKLHSWISLDAYGLLIFHKKLKLFELNSVWRVRPFEYLIKNLLLLLFFQNKSRMTGMVIWQFN